MSILCVHKVQALLRRFLNDECGPTATEYAVMLALIIITSIGVIGLLGQSFAALYAIISGALPTGFA